jgi:hypothetical protein
MTGETGILSQELAIVLWLTIIANVAIWWFLSDLLLESMHRERYGRFRSRWRLALDAVRRPLSAPAIIRSDLVEKYRARIDVADHPLVERQRRRSIAALATYVAVLFFGLPVTFRLVAIVRNVLPGTVALWVVAVDLILLAVWIRRGVRGFGSGSGRLLIVGGSVAGVLLCVISAAISSGLWQTGGIAP